MKFNKKKTLKYLTLAGTALAVTVPTAAVLASCSTASKGFVIASWNDVFANSFTQLGSSYTDAPSTTEFQSVFGALVTYVTEGDYVYDDATNDWASKPESRLVLEAASKIVIYGKDSNGQDTVLHTIDPSNLSDTSAFVNRNGTYSINTEEFGKKMANATKVEFTLNKDFKWVDTSGQPKQSLVPRDFLYSIKGYKNSSDYKLNSNGYFMDLAGINYEETIKLETNNSTEAGGKFTYVISDTTKTPYFLDILTKQYFYPIPHSHPDAAATQETPDTSNVVKFTTSGTDKIIDKKETDWTRVYGGGQEKGVDVWSIGPYYISASSKQDVTFSINHSYFDTMKSTYDMNKLDVTKKIPKIIKRYKQGTTPETIYNLFGSGEVSYAPVPQPQASDASKKYKGSASLISIPAPKTSQGRFIGYNLGIFNEKGQLKDSKLVDSSYEKFVKNFHDDNALKIRKGLNEYINWAKLAEVKYDVGTKDFSLSSIPYGVYPVQKDASTNIDYYKAIGDGATLGVDAGSTDSTDTSVSTIQPKGIIGGKYNQMKDSDAYILANDNEKQELTTALTAMGYKKETPLKLTYWTLSQSKDPKDTAYFTEVGKQIEVLTNQAVTFTYMDFNAASTVDNVYYNKAVPMGDMLWAPDYNGLGTWIGLYFEYEFKNNLPVDTLQSNVTQEKGYDSLSTAYHTTNLWKPLYAVLDAALEHQPINESNWGVSLAKYLKTKGAAAFGEQDTYKTIKPNLSNEISIWAGQSTSNGINLLNWIDSQYPILPLYQPSLNYHGFKLVDPKYQVILNQNGDINYRDFVQNN